MLRDDSGHPLRQGDSFSGELESDLLLCQYAATAFDGEVSGMLLYARTEDVSFESESWTDFGHTYHVRTLDLNQDFAGIAAQLDAIAELVG